METNNKLAVFSNPEFGEVRTLEINGEPWFVGKDVATALGYAIPQKAIQERVDEEDKKNLDYASFFCFGKSLWGENDYSNKTVINESGLYSLIMSSKMEKAKDFKRWVTSEVLPSIRKRALRLGRSFCACIQIKTFSENPLDKCNKMWYDIDTGKTEKE